MKQMLPQQGTITINDTPIANIPSAQWLNHVALVPQDVELFDLSIRDNIVIDRQDTSEDQLETILQQAALDDFIATLPDGLDTLIGERGVKLSGGQRQRLGIARASYAKHPF